jgi:hypothetical protein
MTEPIVFISHFRIKEGALDAYRRMHHEAVRALEADKPRTLAFLPYLDEDGTRLTILHLFADAESMDLHFKGAEERSAKAYEVLVPDGWDIYGTPSDQVLDAMRNAAGASGVTLTLQPEYVGGFLRHASA